MFTKTDAVDQEGTITQLVSELEARHEELIPADYRTRTNQWLMKAGESGPTLVAKVPTAAPRELSLHPRAVDQLSRVLGADPNTIRLLPPELQADAITHLLGAARSTPLMLRTIRGDEVRAILGRNQAVIDDLTLAQWLKGAAEQWPGATTSYHSDAERLEVLFLFRDSEGEAMVGDVVQVGLSIMNSEVGVVSPSACEAVWRLACTNLAVTKTIWQARGRDLGDISAALPRLHGHVGELLRAAAGRRSALRRLADVRLPDRAVAADVFSQLAHLSAEPRRKVKAIFVEHRCQLLPDGGTEPLPASGSGLWNATTAAARDVAFDPSRALSTAAGKLLEQPFQQQLTERYGRAVASRQ